MQYSEGSREFDIVSCRIIRRNWKELIDLSSRFRMIDILKSGFHFPWIRIDTKYPRDRRVRDMLMPVE